MTLFRSWTPWFLASIAAAWAVSIVWWVLLEPAQAASGEDQLIIPEGTAAAVAKGAPAPFIPNSLELGRNRTLVVINRDVVAHRVGTWTIEPGGSAVIEGNTDAGQFTCTIHPAGVLGYRIDQRPPFRTTVYAGLILGIPVGLVSGFASLVGSRLRMDPESDASCDRFSGIE